MGVLKPWPPRRNSNLPVYALIFKACVQGNVRAALQGARCTDQLFIRSCTNEQIQEGTSQ